MKQDNFKVQEIPGRVPLRQLQAVNKERYPYLLESVIGSKNANQFDILFAFPQESLILNNQGCLQGAVLKSKAKSKPSCHFLDVLNEWIGENKIEHSQSQTLPFCGGWFVYLGYELTQQIEAKVTFFQSSDSFPIAFATRCPAAIIVDKLNNISYLFSENNFVKTLEKMQADLHALRDHSRHDGDISQTCIEKLNEDNADLYLRGVEKIKNYIRDGDVFQVNYARTWRAQLKPGVSASEVYHRLCESNPAPFAGLIHWQDYAIISSSPERLVQVQNNIVQTRPIAGTRPRSDDDTRDADMISELLSHPKEIAEHIMLVDLERNDLGRICVPGSIHVDEFVVPETYQHVHHIVSNIRGQLIADCLPGDVIKAVFPGGTITGCPKVRCMEIISELEKTSRGCYTGSMGYINRNGDMDINILIRTLFKDHNKLTIKAGAGIVTDSIPEKELAETRAKAKGMLKALCP